MRSMMGRAKTSLSALGRGSEGVLGTHGILILACLLGLSTSCQRPNSSLTLQPPSRRLAISEQAATRLGRRVAETIREPGPWHLVITEQELTSYVAKNLPANLLHDPEIWFTKKNIYLVAQVGRSGKRKVHAVMTLGSHDGVLRIALQHGYLDTQPLPRFLLISIEEAANAALADIQSPFRVEQLLLNEGFILIEGRRE